MAYVTNGISGTVSVVNLAQRRVVATVPSGTEPRGCALTPNGTLLYVANHTEGTVSIFFTGSNPLNPTPVGKVDVGRNPTALAITNNGDGNDADETVFVTQIFAELNPTSSTAAPARRAISGNKASSRPSRRECQSDDHQNYPAPIADSGFNANRVRLTSAELPPAHSQHLLPGPGGQPLTRTTRRGCSLANSCRR